MDLRRMDKEDFTELLAAIALVVFGLLYALRGTVAEGRFSGPFHTLLLLDAIILFAVTVLKFFGTFPDRRKLWLQSQIPVLIYLALRLIEMGGAGFTGAAFFTFLTADALYLLVLTALTVDGDVIRKGLFPAFLILQMVLEILEIFCTLVVRIAPDGEVAQSVLRNTFLAPDGTGSALYEDPRQMAVMAGLSIAAIFVLAAADEEILNRLLAGVYCLLSLAVILKTEGRLVYIALAVALVVFLLIRVFGVLNARLAVFAALLAAVLLTGASLRTQGLGLGIPLLCRVLFAAVLGIRVWYADSLSEGQWAPVAVYILIAGGLDLSATPDAIPMLLFLFLILAAGPDGGDRSGTQRMGAYFTGLKGWN